jgi:replicative DNA helicase Mcm
MEKITIDKSKTSLTKFEEFFSTIYKDEVSDCLREYPNKRSVIIDYNHLKIYDSDLADLLVEKPEDVILASKKAIEHINPLMKDNDLNIRFKNLSNLILLKNLNARYVGKLVSVDGLISIVKKPEPKIKTAVFECRGCMRLHEVQQGTDNSIIEPSLCSECGGRAFRLLTDDSSYVDTQCLVIKWNDTSKRIKIILKDDLTDYDKYNVNDVIRIVGVLKTLHKNETMFDEFIVVNYIEKLDVGNDIDVEDVNIDYEGRDSAEYKEWVNGVLGRDDSTCVVCGEKRAPHVHHIFSYKNHPDYRLNKENGVVLCRWCHHKYHDIFGKETANPVSFINFLKGDY